MLKYGFSLTNILAYFTQCNIRGLNKKINRIHEKTLRIAYNDRHHKKELLTKDSSVNNAP